eukprot:6202747-Pleurochrysis_carterae.AAC.1
MQERCRGRLGLGSFRVVSPAQIEVGDSQSMCARDGTRSSVRACARVRAYAYVYARVRSGV